MKFLLYSNFSYFVEYEFGTVLPARIVLFGIYAVEKYICYWFHQHKNWQRANNFNVQCYCFLLFPNFPSCL